MGEWRRNEKSRVFIRTLRAIREVEKGFPLLRLNSLVPPCWTAVLRFLALTGVYPNEVEVPPSQIQKDSGEPSKRMPANPPRECHLCLDINPAMWRFLTLSSLKKLRCRNNSVMIYFMTKEGEKATLDGNATERPWGPSPKLQKPKTDLGESTQESFVQDKNNNKKFNSPGDEKTRVAQCSHADANTHEANMMFTGLEAEGIGFLAGSMATEDELVTLEKIVNSAKKVVIDCIKSHKAVEPVKSLVSPAPVRMRWVATWKDAGTSTDSLSTRKRIKARSAAGG